MDFRTPGTECKREGRPPPCPVCGGPAWWNGQRTVAQMLLSDSMGARLVVGLVRLRARCVEPSCRCGSWTVYEAGGYPQRTFTLAVAAAAIAELAFDAEATLTSVARHWGCDRRTVGRWRTWVAGVADPAALARLCSRLDPDGLPAPDPGGIATPGLLLLLLECLVRLLRDQGVPLEPGPGLGAILRHQFERFRAVAWLTRASPPLRVDGAMVTT